MWTEADKSKQEQMKINKQTNKQKYTITKQNQV